MKLQNISADYLPPAELSPLRVYTLPELHYPARLNAAVELLDRTIAAGNSQRPAFYFEERILTYSQISRDVNRFGNALRGLGIVAGDRVLLRLGDQPELIVALLALLKIGAIAVPTYPMLRAHHLIYRERDTEAKAIIVSDDLIEEVEKARREFQFVRQWIAVGGAPPGYRNYSELISKAGDELVPSPTGAADYALIMYSSGSTGDPKGVLWSHADIVAQADSYTRACIRPEPNDVFVGPPPLPFAAGILFFLISPLRFGASALLMKEKSPDRMCDAVTRYRGTICVAMATYYNLVLREKGARVREAFAAVRQTLVGGEPVPRELWDRWHEASGHPLSQFLGTTEMSNCFLSFRFGIDPVRPTSAGRPVPGYQVAVRDPDTFAEVERGQPGLLTVIGPTGTKYWRKPEEQKRAVRNGWNVCQDIVTMDEEQFVYHLARSDDMIVSAGYNISPIEVETVLLQHPKVAEVACVGAPDPTGLRSSIVKAYIVTRLGTVPTPDLVEELQRFFRERGAPYMYPREVVFIDQLPKTVTGKINRSELRRITKPAEGAH